MSLRLESPQLRLESPQCHFVMVTLAFQGGGPERDTILLCNALAAKGVRVTVLVLRDEGPLRSLLEPTVNVVIISQHRIRYAIRALRRTICSLAPTIVVTSGIPCLNLLTLVAVRTLPRRQRPKLVIRESAVPSMANLDPSRSNRIAYRALAHVYRYADRIITLTEGARRELLENFSVPVSMTAVMGLNAVIPPPIINRLRSWDGESGRETDLIVCVGRLSAEKDQRTLLRALMMLPADRQWRLAIIGDGPDRGQLEAFVRSNQLANRTVFTGYVPDPFAWIMRARLLVLSSIYEGLGNTVIEALACGTPVVCTDCRYGPRETLEGGRYGTLTPVGDPAAMAKAIAAALDDVPDRRCLMERGLQFTAEGAAERFLQIVSELGIEPSSSEDLLGAASTS